MARLRNCDGVGMVEFVIIAPILLMVIFGMVDFARYVQANTTVAEAARQGARQAVPNAPSADNPFTGSANGSCSGQVFTYNQTSTTGCLTDAAILTTVKGVLGGVTSNVVLKADKTKAQCEGLAAPAVGQAYVCTFPNDTSAEATAVGCPSGYPTPTPTPTAVSRQQEWSNGNGNGSLKGCFYVTVTVLYRYQTWTPLISTFIGTPTVEASTSMLAEY